VTAAAVFLFGIDDEHRTLRSEILLRALDPDTVTARLTDLSAIARSGNPTLVLWVSLMSPIRPLWLPAESTPQGDGFDGFALSPNSGRSRETSPHSSVVQTGV